MGVAEKKRGSRLILVAAGTKKREGRSGKNAEDGSAAVLGSLDMQMTSVERAERSGREKKQES